MAIHGRAGDFRGLGLGLGPPFGGGGLGGLSRLAAYREPAARFARRHIAVEEAVAPRPVEVRRPRRWHPALIVLAFLLTVIGFPILLIVWLRSRRAARELAINEVDPEPAGAVLRREKAEFAGRPVDLDRLLRPPAASEVMRPFLPRENMTDRANWNAYRRKFQALIAGLPAAVVGSEEERQKLLRALVLGGQGGAYPDAWFNKIMGTAEAERSIVGEKAIRDRVATAINYLQNLQEAGRHGDVYRILQGLTFYADACPDRASFGVDMLAMQMRILARQGAELDPDRRALLLAEELVQQAKMNGVKTALMARYGGRGEAIEGYLYQCLRFKDALGLPVTMDAMLYAGIGRGFAGGDIAADWHLVLDQLSQTENLTGFVATPPEDSQLSGVPQWERVGGAPLAALANPEDEGERGRLLGDVITPMLQALGYIKGPSLTDLRRQALEGDSRAITVLYWMALDGKQGAAAALRQVSIGAAIFPTVDHWGMLAKVGNAEARAALVEKVGELRAELRGLPGDMESEERRSQIFVELSQIGRYGIDKAITALEGIDGGADSLWVLAQRGDREAIAAMGRLLDSGNDDARMIVSRARSEGDPVALELMPVA